MRRCIPSISVQTKAQVSNAVASGSDDDTVLIDALQAKWIERAPVNILEDLRLVVVGKGVRVIGRTR
jgi:hypothetical protein